MTRTSAATLTLGLTGAAPARRRAPTTRPRPGTAPIQVTSTDTECKVSSHRGPQRQPPLRRQERRPPGHRVLPAGRRRAADHRRSGEHRPRADPRTWWSRAPAGQVHHGVQARHAGRRHPRRASKSPNPATRPPSTPIQGAHRHRPPPSTWPTSRTRPNSCWPAPRSSRRPTQPGTPPKARELYAATPHALGADRAGGRVLRRPRPKLDAREADLEPRARSGPAGTGPRRTSSRPPDSQRADRAGAWKQLAAQLVADTEDLAERTRTVELTADKLGNGAKELLDEVATGKVTGEEEIWSHTDLWDFQANVDGARIAFENLKPVLEQKDPELAKSLDDEVRRAAGRAQPARPRRGLRVLQRAEPGAGPAAGRAGGCPGRAAVQAHRRRRPVTGCPFGGARARRRADTQGLSRREVIKLGVRLSRRGLLPWPASAARVPWPVARRAARP